MIAIVLVSVYAFPFHSFPPIYLSVRFFLSSISERDPLDFVYVSSFLWEKTSKTETSEVDRQESDDSSFLSIFLLQSTTNGFSFTNLTQHTFSNQKRATFPSSRSSTITFIFFRLFCYYHPLLKKWSTYESRYSFQIVPYGFAWFHPAVWISFWFHPATIHRVWLNH